MVALLCVLLAATLSALALGALRGTLGDRDLSSAWPWPWPWPTSPSPSSSKSSAFIYPFLYPSYSQCENVWRRNILQQQDICAVGCFLTSISMGLAGRDITLPPNNSTINPAALNSWLRQQTDPPGYVATDVLNTPVLTRLSPRISLGSDYMHKKNDLSPSAVIALLKQGKVVLANVRHGQHFVLVVGFPARGAPYSNSTAFAVQDPAHFQSSYTYSSIVGWRVFTIAAS